MNDFSTSVPEFSKPKLASLEVMFPVW